MTDLPDMTYREALEELRLRFEVNKIPEYVLTRFLDLLKSPHKLIGPVHLDRFTLGTPDFLSSLQASKLLKELVIATRERTLDWKVIVVMIEHAATPELSPT